ncbi:MAG: DUF2007 domain-containing protein [Pseudomonadota bacterium]
MHKIYQTSDPILAGLLESVLKEAGIKCLVKNSYLSGALGELPINECWPEVWIVDADDQTRAEAIVAEFAGRQNHGAQWRCPQCAEMIEGQFAMCWSCGASPS